MKDLTKYIRTLIDEVDIPSEIRLQEDGVYRIDVNVDLKTLKEIVGNQNNATMIVSQKSTIELEYEQTMQMD